MPVNDYCGIEGFCVNAQSSQDVYTAIDRMHTQIIDEIEALEIVETRIMKRDPSECLANLKQTLQILEEAMDKLMDIEGVKCI